MKTDNVDLSIKRLATPIFVSLQPLILASESPRRIRLLRSLGVTVEVIPSGIEEGDDPKQEPSTLATCRAKEKAQAVSRLYPHSWVLSADTIVVLQDTIFGKPETAEQAIAMLQQLSGQRHHVLSGLCLMRLDPPFERVTAVRTEVRFKPITDAEIRAYVKTGEPRIRPAPMAFREEGHSWWNPFMGPTRMWSVCPSLKRWNGCWNSELSLLRGEPSHPSRHRYPADGGR